MHWWEILKVDADFDLSVTQDGLFGQYEKGQLDLRDLIEGLEEIHGGSLPRSVVNHYGKRFYEKLKEDAKFRGKPVEMKDVIQEKITVHPVPIYNKIKRMMGKEPTDKQMIDFIVSTLMHEGTHAGMSEEQDFMSVPQSEYGAFTGQFPNNTFYRLKQFTQHGDNIKEYLPRATIELIGINPESVRSESRFSKRAELIVGYIMSLTELIKPTLKKRKYQERLARLEILSIKKDAKFIGDIMDWAKSGNKDGNKSLFEALLNLGDRYEGFSTPEDQKMFDDIRDSFLQEMFGNDMTKQAMTVTTASSPAMFNNKAIRRKKKRDEDGEG